MATTGASDAILVVGEWISEHYFTTDAKSESFTARVLGRRKDWDSRKDDGTPRTRLTAARQQLLSQLASVHANPDPEAASDVNAELFTILGYGAIGLSTDHQGPVTFVRSAGLDEPVLAIVNAQVAETTEDLIAKDAENLATPFVVDDKVQITSVARLLSTLFVSDDVRPAFALVLAGTRLLVAERERWPEGRYLAIDLQLVLERSDDRKGGELDRALTCVAAESLAPDSEGNIWWAATLEESVKHTVGVSKEASDY